MRIELDQSGSISGFQKICDNLGKDPQVKSILVFACEANDFSPQNMNNYLTSQTKPIFGGIFPEIIHYKEKLSKGTCVAGLSIEPQIGVISDLSDPTKNYDLALETAFPDPDVKGTMFVLVDGFAKRITSLIDSLFNVFGLEINFLGGGAGSLSMVPAPCLFSNQGLLQDQAIVALLDTKSGTGVSHGWQVVTGPYKVTSADQNTIYTLDQKPAFEVYKQVIEQNAQAILTKENFFDLAKNFPFGITKLGSEKLVRDPILPGEDGSIICVGEVPRESYLHILTGNTKDLVKAAGTALSLALQNFPDDPKGKPTIFIDCISRVLFLGDNFKKELDAVYQPNTPMIGALTLGEIANNGQEYLEFYNKTSVVGILDI